MAGLELNAPSGTGPDTARTKAGASPGVDALVEADLLRLMYQKSPFTHIVSVINASLYTFIVGAAVPARRALTWLAIIAVVASIRVGIRQAYWRRPRGPDDTERWQRISVAAAVLNGCAWGSVAMIAYPEESPIWQMLQTIMIASATGVASAYSASHLPSYFAYTIPATLPLFAVHLSHGDSFHVVLTVLAAIVILQMASVAITSERAFREAARLRFETASLNQTLESKVAERTAELAAALTARDEFIWVASHEFRTPVTSLLLSAQNMERMSRDDASPSAPRNARAAATIIRQSRQLARLIEEMFDGAVIEAGGLELHAETSVDLAGVARAAAASVEQEAAQSGSTIEIEAPSVAVVGAWDRALLEKALVHLLSNAIKFGRGEPIRVRIAPHDGHARVSVIDCGIGITEDQQARMFERFHRGVPARHYGGLGLGLYVVRQIVRRHGGTVSCESAPQRGTTITIELPLAPI